MCVWVWFCLCESHVCAFVNSFCAPCRTTKYRHEWVTSWNTHAKGTRVSGRDQWEGGGAGTRSDQGVIDCYRDGAMCPSLWGESRRGKAACRRPFLCLMTRSWCLILASQHWGLSVRTGKKERWGEGGVTKYKKINQLSGLWYNRCYRFAAELQFHLGISQH